MPGFAFAWGNDAEGVRPDDGHAFFSGHMISDHHVVYRYILCQNDDRFESCVNGFVDAIDGKFGWCKGNGGISAGGFYSLAHGVEDRYAFDHLAAFAWCHASNDIGAGIQHLFGMVGALTACDALYQ